jgi:hypothetical protein
MPSKRAEGKRFVGWWAPEAQQERLAALAARDGVDRGVILSRAADEYLDRNETPEHDPEEPKP